MTVTPMSVSIESLAGAKLNDCLALLGTYFHIESEYLVSLPT